jgi:hypothetical protein
LSEKRRVGDSLVGVAVLGAVVTGAAGLIGALWAFFSGELNAAALFLVAAALSFGLLGISVLGK